MFSPVRSTLLRGVYFFLLFLSIPFLKRSLPTTIPTATTSTPSQSPSPSVRWPSERSTLSRRELNGLCPGMTWDMQRCGLGRVRCQDRWLLSPPKLNFDPDFDHHRTPDLDLDFKSNLYHDSAPDPVLNFFPPTLNGLQLMVAIHGPLLVIHRSPQSCWFHTVCARHVLALFNRPHLTSPPTCLEYHP